MSVFQRGRFWWYEFEFRGQRFRASTSSTSKEVAKRAERARRLQLEEGINQLKAVKRPLAFAGVAKQWLEVKTPQWSTSNLRIESYNVGHLVETFGKLLLTDITPDHISRYQAAREREGASKRTINMEVGTLRAILRKHRLWSNLQPDVKMLRVRSDIGRALSQAEAQALLVACQKSRSRSLYPAVLLSIHTGLRNRELRLLRWRQIDLLGHTVTVGRSKTSGGEGRVVPLSKIAQRVIQEWRSEFPDAMPDHYVFPSERYGLAGEDGYLHGALTRYGVRPDVPMGSWKVAWSNALQAAGVQCRWHDLRHTFVSWIAESQTSDATIMALAGHLSVKMKEKYSHVRQQAKRNAIATFDVIQ